MALESSRLLTTDYVRGFIDAVVPNQRPTNGVELAELLVTHQRLTQFQVDRLLEGQTHGIVLGEYVLLEPIGEGGMGCVYKARHRRMQREVALKVLSPQVSDSAEDIERFQREVLAAAILNHPNIVTAYDASEHEGTDYLVMEYVEGIDLAQLVKEEGPLPIGRAVDYTIQAAYGLQYANRKGVVHRDIKPANLLLDKEGTVKILDMGLARITRNPSMLNAPGMGFISSSHVTQVGGIMGTVDYMAPEQARDANAADHRSDLYSLGSTLFYLLTNRHPFEGESWIEKLAAKDVDDAPLISSFRPDIPELLTQLISSVLARDPEQRPQNGFALVQALLPFADSESSTTNLPSLGATEWDDSMPVPAGHEGRGDSAPQRTPPPKKVPPGKGAVKQRGGKGLLEPEILQPLPINELPICTQLSFNLNDLGGKTLVYAGTAITPRLLEELRRKRIDTVWAHEIDVEKLLGPRQNQGLATTTSSQTLNCHTSTTQKLDREIRNPNLLEVIKTGPSFRDRLKPRKPTLLDAQMVSEMSRVHGDAAVRVKDLIAGLQSMRENHKAHIASGNVALYSIMDMMQQDLDVVLGQVVTPAEDRYLIQHSLAMAILGMAIATEMRFDERNVLLVGLTGLLHDMGMQRVPKDLRDLPRRLNDKEYQEVMKHVVYTAEILEARGLPSAVRLASYQIHERCDGSGYPRGKDRHQIHPIAHILAVADVYTALISPRPYRRAMLPYSAMEYLLRQTGNAVFDPQAIRGLLQVVSLLPVGSYLILNDNRVGRVIRSNPEYDRPVIEVLFDADGRAVEPSEVVNLASNRELRVLHDIRAPETPSE